MSLLNSQQQLLISEKTEQDAILHEILPAEYASKLLSEASSKVFSSFIVKFCRWV